MSDTITPVKLSYLNLIGIRTLVERELRREVRFFGVSVIGPALQAALFAIIITIAVGENMPKTNGLDYIVFLSTGFIITSMLQRAFESTAFSLMFDKLEGNIEDLLGAPFSGFEILLSYTISSMFVASTIGISVWLVLLLMGGPTMPIHIPELVAAILIGCFLFSSAGVLATIWSEKWDKLSAKETFFVMPLMFLSGSFFPRSAVIEELQFLLDYNPVFRLVEAVRYGFTGAHELDVWAGLGMASIWMVVIWAITLVVLSTGYKIKP
ncbi:ABC transporter permease [Curvivirga sp.]|uniref:ABC transporter permease n=1 Tax=Curvivirga sp. TaxID=2856848 RepID=UPI003B5BB06B